LLSICRATLARILADGACARCNPCATFAHTKRSVALTCPSASHVHQAERASTHHPSRAVRFWRLTRCSGGKSTQTRIPSLCADSRAPLSGSRRFIGRVAALRISTSSARSGSHCHEEPKRLPIRNIGPSQVALLQSVPDHKEGSRKAPGRSVESLLAPLLSLITGNRLRKLLRYVLQLNA
jgi:hypothetical protein